MKHRKDILVNQTNELQIINGDFVIGPSDVQHIDHIVTAMPGEYKLTPQLGFGVQKYLKSITTKTEFKRNLRVQLKFDGYPSPKINLEKGFEKLEIKTT